MQSLGLDVAMPSFLDGKRQLSAEEANQSRCITKVRWVVEAANRRIKQFKYFANTVQNSSLIYLESDLSIACALINCYHKPMATSKPEDRAIGEAMIELLQQKNRIKTVNNYRSALSYSSNKLQMLDENNLIKRPSQWETIDHREILDCFPVLSEEDIGDLTFGNERIKLIVDNPIYLRYFPTTESAILRGREVFDDKASRPSRLYHSALSYSAEPNPYTNEIRTRRSDELSSNYTI
jgi:hypothetical protein